MTVRTRMAPSPTGEFHIGGMRTLLYNYAVAKKNNGQFVLRIEDTDQERLVPGAVERLLQVLKDYGLSWDEGPVVEGPYKPYIQSQRLDIYNKYALELIEKGAAYYCFCSKERLDTLRSSQREQKLPTTKYDKHCLSLTKDQIEENLKNGLPYVIRLNVHAGQTITFKDKILGEISFPTNDIDDQVLLKSDGFPTYHLAVVVDDHLMNINLIMRGVEWLPSTPKHIMLYQAFGWELPEYAHVPLLREENDTKKLSKRMGSVASTEFLKEGYLPEAILNFLMFLGWNPGTEKEIYSLEEFISDFSIEKIQKTDLVVFGRQKLLWYNGSYIRSLSSEALYQKIYDWYKKFDIKLPNISLFLNDDKLRAIKIIESIKDRIHTYSQVDELISYFYLFDKKTLDEVSEFLPEKENFNKVVSAYSKILDQVDEKIWNKENLDTICHREQSNLGFGPKEVFMTLRLIITGLKATPPLFEVMEILGKKETLARINHYISIINR